MWFFRRKIMHAFAATKRSQQAAAKGKNKIILESAKEARFNKCQDKA